MFELDTQRSIRRDTCWGKFSECVDSTGVIVQKATVLFFGSACAAFAATLSVGLCLKILNFPDCPIQIHVTPN